MGNLVRILKINIGNAQRILSGHLRILEKLEKNLWTSKVTIIRAIVVNRDSWGAKVGVIVHPGLPRVSMEWTGGIRGGFWNPGFYWNLKIWFFKGGGGISRISRISRIFRVTIAVWGVGSGVRVKYFKSWSRLDLVISFLARLNSLLTFDLISFVGVTHQAPTLTLTLTLIQVGLPKITAGSDNCFHTCCPYVRPHFSKLTREISNCSLLARLWVWPSGSLMTPVLFYFKPVGNIVSNMAWLNRSLNTE